MNPPSVCFLRLRIISAVIGAIVGLAVFPSFGFVYQNWPAGIWGLVSGLVAGVVTTVHVLQTHEYWRTHFKALRPVFYVACLLSVAAICGFIVFLVLAIVIKRPFTTHGRNDWIVLVWCFMTFKWSLALFLYSRQYYCVYAGTAGFKCMFGIVQGQEILVNESCEEQSPLLPENKR